MARYVCVHGHFYQPPRENPWLDGIEVQESAEPFHDWNERITAECYRPNAWARVLDTEGLIVQIQSNYAHMSFNFGPTLLRWLEGSVPDVYDAILKADRESRERFSGHGSAIAQAYNHQILPLANSRDKRTQVRWGIRDFRRRFGRDPEGMWLPETAVDAETLAILAEEGIAFTILAPSQALRYRPIGNPEWTDAEPGIPPTRPYRVSIPGTDRSIAVFFYDGPISHDLAFGGVLDDGRQFADRLLAGFTPSADSEDELVHIATDGETYGHHHRHGEMALAMALRLLRESGAKITNYGEYLARHPPSWEVEVKDATSWSCVHGVERWRSNCGCQSGMHPGWQQTWRTPLRESLDWLRDTLYPKYDEHLGHLLADPWGARDDYVDLMASPMREGADEFLARHRSRELSTEETQKVLEFLEMQRHLQQMYTSCGWFFDDLAGIETVQCLQYAARAIQIAERVLGEPFEGEFKRRLTPAMGNVPENGDGAQTYDTFALPARIDLPNVCGHYALSSLFEDYGEHPHIYCYSLERVERRVLVSGVARLALGRAMVRSDLTREEGHFTYGALHVGGHILLGGVRPFQGNAPYAKSAARLTETLEKGDLVAAIRVVDEEFGSGTYSLRLLFRDEQRKIVSLLLEATLHNVEVSFRQIYETAAPILRYLADANSTAPAPLRRATEFYANLEIRRNLDAEVPKVDEAAGWLRQLSAMGLGPDSRDLGYAWSRAAERLLDAYVAHPEDEALLRHIEELTDLPSLGTMEIDMAGVQNRYYEFLHGPFAQARASGAATDESARKWWESFRRLGERLRVRVP